MQRNRSKTSRRAIGTIGIATLAAVAAIGTATASSFTGPSTNVPPYLIPGAAGVDVQSLFTVGNQTAQNGYQMVGVPDGMGVQGKGNNTVLYMNHELQATQGIVRAHGQEGSFVSKLTIRKSDGKVLKGEDLIKSVQYFDYGTLGDNAGTYGTTAPLGFDARFGRFCSATLAPANLFYNPVSKKGTKNPIFLTNEETGDTGRTFGVTKDGVAWQLPHLGLFSWENTVPAHNTSDTTLVMGNEDGGTTTSEMWVYVGAKEKGAGKSDVQKAGLANGTSNVIAVSDGLGGTLASDAAFRATHNKGDLVPFTLSEVPWDATGAAQNAEADVDGTSFDRIEDGNWDPANPNDYYFVTTRGGEGVGVGGGGGLWVMHFADIEHPELGGNLELLLDGTESITLNNPDNLTIDGHGNILLQEDPGSNPVVSRIVAYRQSDGALGTVAQFDPNLFTPGLTNFITQDEESSGIVDLEPVGYPAGTFLFDAQVHSSTGLAADPNPGADDPGTVDEFVERGQVLKLTVNNWTSVYGS